MCRNIKPLFNYDPPAKKEEIHEASTQFIRKISGFAKPSGVNEKPFEHAINRVDEILADLLKELKTTAPKRNREVEAKKAQKRAIKRFS